MIEEIRKALKREMEIRKTSGKKLARDAGTYPKLVSDIMTKKIDPRVGTLVKLAETLGVHPSFLLDQFIPVTGKIKDGGKVVFVKDPDPHLVPRPPSRKGELVALLVEDNGLAPLHRKGDVIYISKCKETLRLDYVGDECVVQDRDGQAYLRILGGETDGRRELRHWTGAEAEQILLDWAAPVLSTLKSREVPPRPKPA